MTLDEKRAAAVAFLGAHYVLHPSRRIPKGDYQPVVQRANVRATFERVRAQIEQTRIVRV